VKLRDVEAANLEHCNTIVAPILDDDRFFSLAARALKIGANCWCRSGASFLLVLFCAVSVPHSAQLPTLRLRGSRLPYQLPLFLMRRTLPAVLSLLASRQGTGKEAGQAFAINPPSPARR
jgi:hypothetical protein